MEKGVYWEQYTLFFRLKIKTFLQNGKEPFHFDKI